MNRKEMYEMLPEEHREDLKEIIDHIEIRVNNIESKLDIMSLDDLGNINEAMDMVKELSKDLY